MPVCASCGQRVSFDEVRKISGRHGQFCERCAPTLKIEPPQCRHCKRILGVPVPNLKTANNNLLNANANAIKKPQFAFNAVNVDPVPRYKKVINDAFMSAPATSIHRDNLCGACRSMYAHVARQAFEAREAPKGRKDAEQARLNQQMFTPRKLQLSQDWPGNINAHKTPLSQARRTIGFSPLNLNPQINENVPSSNQSLDVYRRSTIGSGYNGLKRADHITPTRYLGYSSSDSSSNSYYPSSSSDRYSSSYFSDSASSASSYGSDTSSLASNSTIRPYHYQSSYGLQNSTKREYFD